jgi:uncharacterized protein
MTDDKEQRPESLLPYDEWTEAAMRQVMIRALTYAAANGLPGDHHFYITFRTDHPNTVIPPRLRAQYPQEMTIILQHQFWNMKVDEAAGEFSVGLSFGGVPSELHIPLGGVTGFADPHVRFGLQFRAEPLPDEPEAAEPEALPAPEPETEKSDTPQVVSLDAFRRRTPPKD